MNRTIARLNDNGSLDPTFDGDGKVLTDFGGADSEDVVRALDIDNTGRIIAAGDFGAPFAEGQWLAVQPDGRAVVGGWTSDTQSGSNPRFAAARFRTDGTPDPTFGQGSIATFATNPASFPTDMFLTGNGGLVFSGISPFGPTLVRLRTSDRVAYRPPSRPPFAPLPREILQGARTSSFGSGRHDPAGQ